MVLAQNSQILLRPLSEKDLTDFHAYRSDPIVCRYQGFDPYTEEKALAFLQKSNWVDLQKEGKWMQIGIVQQSSQRLVGDCALRFQAYEPRIAEVGCTLNRNFQGQGLAFQSMQLLLQTIFSQKNTHKITALMDERNKSAIKVIEQLGFVKEAHFRKSYFDKLDGDWFGEYQYGLLREEWHL